jgi:hypothetical protein
MARPADGKIAKAGSRSALFAHIAARLAQQQRKGDSRFFREVLRINVHEKAGRDAATASGSSLRKWMLVREPDLDLDVSLLRFRPGSRSPEEIYETLGQLSGVRQLLRIGTSGEILAVVVFDGARMRRELRAVIQERLQLRPQWEEIEQETFQPALRTWRDLARKAARDEGLALGGASTDSPEMLSER